MSHVNSSCHVTHNLVRPPPTPSLASPHPSETTRYLLLRLKDIQAPRISIKIWPASLEMPAKWVWARLNQLVSRFLTWGVAHPLANKRKSQKTPKRHGSLNKNQQRQLHRPKFHRQKHILSRRWWGIRLLRLGLLFLRLTTRCLWILWRKRRLPKRMASRPWTGRQRSLRRVKPSRSQKTTPPRKKLSVGLDPSAVRSRSRKKRRTTTVLFWEKSRTSSWQRRKRNIRLLLNLLRRHRRMKASLRRFRKNLSLSSQLRKKISYSLRVRLLTLGRSLTALLVSKLVLWSLRRVRLTANKAVKMKSGQLGATSSNRRTISRRFKILAAAPPNYP